MSKSDKPDKAVAKAFGLELYVNILEQVKDLAMMKGISEEVAASVLLINELRQLHWHLDRFDAALIRTSKESKAEKSKR